MKKVKVICLMLVGGFLFGCAHPTTVPSSIPKAPPKVENVQPSIADARNSVGEISGNSRKINDKLIEQKSSIAEQKNDLSAAVAQAEEMRKKIIEQQKITEVEISSLVDRLHDATARNLFQELKNAEIVAENTNLQQSVTKSLQKISEAEKKAFDKDNEASVLRGQNEDLSKSLDQRNKDVDAINKKLDKSEKTAASAAVYKHWVIGLALGYITLTILRNVLMAYGIKLRI